MIGGYTWLGHLGNARRELGDARSRLTTSSTEIDEPLAPLRPTLDRRQPVEGTQATPPREAPREDTEAVGRVDHAIQARPARNQCTSGPLRRLGRPPVGIPTGSARRRVPWLFSGYPQERVFSEPAGSRQ